MSPTDEKRLENYDKMYRSIKLGLEDASKRMDQLKQQGKQRSVTYKQLMTQKLTYKNILELYKLYDLDLQD